MKFTKLHLLLKDKVMKIAPWLWQRKSWKERRLMGWIGAGGWRARRAMQAKAAEPVKGKAMKRTCHGKAAKPVKDKAMKATQAKAAHPAQGKGHGKKPGSPPGHEGNEGPDANEERTPEGGANTKQYININMSIKCIH